MSEKKKRTSGLLDRTPGNIPAREAFMEADDAGNNVVNENQLPNKSNSKPKKSFQYQKKNIKVSGEQLDQLDALKKIQNLRFNYEVIEFLINHYIKTASSNEVQRFKRYTE